MDHSFGVAKVEFGNVAQKVHVGFPERADGAHVLPIAFESVGVHFFSRIEHCGQNVFAEILFGIGVFFVQFEIFEQL